MASSGTLRRVPLVRTDVSDKLSSFFFFRVIRIGELGKKILNNIIALVSAK
jgi:hypothetical protein